MSTFEKKPQASPDIVTADNVSYDNTDSGLTADNVKEAIDEIATGGSAGDVSGPASSVDSNIVLFDGIDGKTIKDSGVALSAKEDVANKSTSVPTDGSSDTKYPSVKAVKDYADGLVAGLLDYRGAYDASGNAYPTTGGSGTVGAILKGDLWIISVAGTLGGEAVQVGDEIIASTDTPGQTSTNWNHLNGNISYVPENVANKETSALDTSTTKYPCNNVVKTGIESIPTNANNILSNQIFS